MENTTEQENNRDEKGRFVKGVSGNPGGRPKGSMKDYVRNYLADMTPEEKKEWIKDVPKDLQWRMSEGNPHQTTDNKTEVTLPEPLLKHVFDNQSSAQDTEDEKEDTSD